MSVNQHLSELLDLIGKKVSVQVDRPIGTPHPMNVNFIYPINFGQTSDVKGITGNNIDVYIMGIEKPCKKFKGICVAVIYPPKNKGFRLIVAPEGQQYSYQEMHHAVDFQERFFKSRILRKVI
jgi:inorganic pyrophosphatase